MLPASLPFYLAKMKKSLVLFCAVKNHKNIITRSGMFVKKHLN